MCNINCRDISIMGSAFTRFTYITTTFTIHTYTSQEIEKSSITTLGVELLPCLGGFNFNRSAVSEAHNLELQLTADRIEAGFSLNEKDKRAENKSD